MFIVATGLVCPVGLNASAACASLRANISAFDELPYCDNQGEPVIGSAVPGIDEFPRRAPQLLELLVKALENLVTAPVAAGWDNVPLLIGLAEPDRPGGLAELAPSIVAQVQQALNVRFHPQHSRTFANGHTAAFEALAAARRLLDDSTIPACLVCGVDSFLGARTLHWLDRDFRLKTPSNRDGAIPGEAAAAVLVQKRPSTGAVTEIAGLGFGKEMAHILSGEPLIGLGLTEAVRTALTEAKLGMHEIDCRLSDVTGELYGFKELPLVEARLMRVVRKVEQPMWHWAEVIGDTGAAAGVLQLVAADEAFRKGYAPGERLLCLTSCVTADRAAAVLRKSPS